MTSWGDGPPIATPRHGGRALPGVGQDQASLSVRGKETGAHHRSTVGVQHRPAVSFEVTHVDQHVGWGAARQVQQGSGTEVHLDACAMRHLGLGGVVHDHATLLVGHGPIDHRSISRSHVDLMDAAGEGHGPSAPCAIDRVLIAGRDQHGTAIATEVHHGQRGLGRQASRCGIEAHHVSCAQGEVFATIGRTDLHRTQGFRHARRDAEHQGFGPRWCGVMEGPICTKPQVVEADRGGF